MNTLPADSLGLSVIENTSTGSTAERRAKLFELESIMLHQEQVDIPVEHHFHGDIYMRSITIPEGACIVGRIHLFDHFEILMSGDITVSTDEGDPKRYTGSAIIKGKAGKKRAFYAHETSTFMTVHAVEEREPAEMWDYMTCDSFEAFEAFHHALHHYQQNENERALG